MVGLTTIASMVLASHQLMLRSHARVTSVRALACHHAQIVDNVEPKQAMKWRQSCTWNRSISRIDKQHGGGASEQRQ